MIVTPEHLIKQYFPQPVETTRDLYNRLQLEESGYHYLNWINDLEEHCLSKYVDKDEYELLPDSEKNYKISQKAFRTIIEASPSKIGDQIRACVAYISRRVAVDPAFARQLQDQLDQEHGVERVIPKVSKKLKARYNETGQDAFEFSVQADNRLHMDIISAYNFQPGQKIKAVRFFFKMEVEDGVPFHIVDFSLSLSNNDMLSYRTIWPCSEERLRYAAILSHRVVRVNLFGDNKKLIDSFEYLLGPSDIETLEHELEKVIDITGKIDPRKIDFDQLGKKILNRYNLNDQAYILAVKEVIPDLPKNKEKESADLIEAAFLEAVNQYWESYVLQPDPTRDFIDDLEQMVKDRKTRVALALLATNMLNYGALCDRYFKRPLHEKQRKALLSASNIRLIYALAAAEDFDPAAAPDRRIADMCIFISAYFDLIKQTLMEMGQWPK